MNWLSLNDEPAIGGLQMRGLFMCVCVPPGQSSAAAAAEHADEFTSCIFARQSVFYNFSNFLIKIAKRQVSFICHVAVTF